MSYGTKVEDLLAEMEPLRDEVARLRARVAELDPVAPVDRLAACLRAVLFLIRRDAPGLSGKALGLADAALQAYDTAAPAPVAQHPLTDELIKSIYWPMRFGTAVGFARAIERAHGIGKEGGPA